MSFPQVALKGLCAAKILLPHMKNLTTHQKKIAGSSACQVAEDGKRKDETFDWLPTEGLR